MLTKIGEMKASSNSHLDVIWREHLTNLTTMILMEEEFVYLNRIKVEDDRDLVQDLAPDQGHGVDQDPEDLDPSPGDPGAEVTRRGIQNRVPGQEAVVEKKTQNQDPGAAARGQSRDPNHEIKNPNPAQNLHVTQRDHQAEATVKREIQKR